MKPVELFAPEAYWRLTPEAMASFRCGPGRGILEAVVPDYWWGFIFWKNLCVQPACGPHDWYYAVEPPTGITLDAWKSEADEVLRNNLIRLVEHRFNEENHPMWLLKHRLRLCQYYYEAVITLGGPAFWNGKNKASEVGLVMA